jgi:PAS domain S-box-containing protein
VTDSRDRPNREALERRLAELERAESGRDRAEQVQAALYRIAETASTAADMQDFYANVHATLRELMYADNFYIALYDAERDTINFPYYVDQVDLDIPNPRDWEPFGIGNAAGLTAYLLRTGEPLLADLAEQHRMEERQDIAQVGEDSVDWLGVPLRSEEKTLGAIVVQSYTEEFVHTDADKELLTFVGQHVAAALERTRLIDETRRRAAELEIVNSIGKATADQLELDALIERLGDQLCEVFEADLVYVALHDTTSDLIEFSYYSEGGERRANPPMRYGEGLTTEILRSREPMLLNRAESFEQISDEVVGTPVRSFLGVPILAGGNAIGVISVQSIEGADRFGEADARLLSTIAANVGAAIQNARLYQETQRRARETAALAKLGREVGGLLELDPILHEIAERARELLEADTSAVFLEEEEGGRYRPLVALGDLADLIMADTIEPGEGIIGDLASRGAPEIVNDVANDRRAVQIRGSEEEEEERLMAAPLLARGRVIGMMAVWRTAPAELFTDADLSFLVSLSQHAAVAIQNARLYQATREAEESYRQLSENMPVSMYLQIAGEGGVSYPQYVSPQTERIFGYPLERWLEPGFQESLIHSDDRDEVLTQYAQAYERAEERFSLEYRVVHADGRTIWVRDEGVGILGEDGERRLIQGFIQDVTDRALAERELHETTERYRLLVENLPISMYVEAPDDTWGSITTYVSPQVEALYGYPSERWLEPGWFENVFLHPDDREWVWREYEEIYDRRDERWEMEYRIVKADGTTAWLRDIGTIRTNEDGTIGLIQGFGQDVTERVLAEKELGEAEERYREVAENMPGMLYMERPVEAGISEVLYVSPQIERIYGYPVERYMQTGFQEDVIHPADREWVLRRYEEVYASELPYWELEYRFLHADGHTMWIRDHAVAMRKEDGALDYVLGFTMDVTDRALAEAEIRRQKQYFASLVDISPVAVVTMDRDEIVSGWNPAAARLFGYTPDEAIGKHVDALVVPEELAQEGDAIVREATEDGRAHRLSRRRSKDGRTVEVEIDIVPLVVDGDHQGYYAIYHDVSELQEARRAADAANEAKSAFLATMSHEIRTPMNAIIGMGGLLLDTELDAEQREYAATIANSGENLLSIINDILDFSKIEAGRMELEQAPFDLRACIESVVELIGPVAAKKGLELAYEIEPGVPETALGDVSRIRQILLNLLNNAVKFTERGEIVLTMIAEPTAAPDAVGYHVMVRDTGIGVPPDRVHRLFESFSQADTSTSRRFGGTGLGLAISKRLAELMSGTMWVESAGVPGEGSTFHVTFVAGITDMAPTALRADATLGDRRALVVDDNATNRRLMTALLAAWGIEAVEADGAVTAMHALDAGRVNLAVLDMVMPGLDGLDLAAKIHERDRAMPIVLATSVGRRDVTADPRWGTAGVAAVVAKPVKASTLHTAVAKALGAISERSPEAGGTAALDPALGAEYPLRILLTEDNAVNQKLAIRLLDRLGYRADVAGNGLEAIQAVERQPYDLVLMDVQMPEMDGLEATRRIVERWGEGERPWIVAMTAEAMQGDRERCLAAGMNDYVTKPIRPAELVAAIRRTPRRVETPRMG